MMKPSASLAAYIETEIIPRYAAFDRAHTVEPDMVYTVAAYHDTGLVAGRERHHLVSGELLAADAHLRRWFSEEQLATMRDAVEDHRASSAHTPRTLYGRIVAEADRCIDPETILRRTVQYGLAHCPAPDREAHFRRCVEHLENKYAEQGYIRLWIPESGNARKLEELRALIRDKERLRSLFDAIFTQESASGSR